MGSPLLLETADLTALPDHVPAGRRLLGFDVGTKTIGLAVSDPAWQVATPRETLRRRKFSQDVELLEKLVAESDIGGFVIGLPVNMNGTEGPRCQAMRAFARNLQARIPLPAAFWDERLSTAAVTRTLLEADTSRARRSDVVDKLAAAYILQGALDRLARALSRPDGT